MSQLPRRAPLSVVERMKRVEPPMVTATNPTVTFLFTDIQNSTYLWNKNAECMRAALKLHNLVFRSLMPSLNAYEVHGCRPPLHEAWPQPRGVSSSCLKDRPSYPPAAISCFSMAADYSPIRASHRPSAAVCH